MTQDTKVILCVDDEPGMLFVLPELLAPCEDDTVVEIAVSGPEALELCADLNAFEQYLFAIIEENPDPATVAKFRQRFATLQNHVSTMLGGTGLGLSITNDIIQKHNGTLSISSTLGSGSCFAVALPWAA